MGKSRMSPQAWSSGVVRLGGLPGRERPRQALPLESAGSADEWMSGHSAAFPLQIGDCLAGDWPM